MSLRARLLITSVVLVAAGLLVANVATYRLLSNFLLNRLDDQLVAAQGPILDSLQFEGDIPGHPTPMSLVPLGTYAEVRNGSGAPLVWKFFGYEIKADQRPVCPRNLPGSTSSPTQAPRFFTTTANGGDPTYRAVAAALSPGPGTLIVAIPLTEVSATLDRLLVVELVVSGIALLLVAGLALWLVRLGLRPLEGIGATAGAIAAGDLSRRVEPATERTEVGRLGLALNAMLAQIEAAFEERRASEDRLRRFVADASHELRTPLTSIRGYAELFRRGADSRPEDLAKSMRRIEAAAARTGAGRPGPDRVGCRGERPSHRARPADRPVRDWGYRLDGRRGQAPPGPGQPPGQRAGPYATRDAGAGEGGSEPPRGAPVGRRPRPGSPARSGRSRVRTLLPWRSGTVQRDGRRGAGALHRVGHRGGARRKRDRRLAGWGWCCVRGQAAGPPRGRD